MLKSAQKCSKVPSPVNYQIADFCCCSCNGFGVVTALVLSPKLKKSFKCQEKLIRYLMAAYMSSPPTYGPNFKAKSMDYD